MLRVICGKAYTDPLSFYFSLFYFFINWAEAFHHCYCRLTQIFPAGQVTLQSVSLPFSFSATGLQAGLFIDMKHRQQKDEGETDESVWERNATCIPLTHKTAAPTTAGDKTCMLWGDETKVHGSKICTQIHTYLTGYSTNTLMLVVQDRSSTPNLFFLLIRGPVPGDPQYSTFKIYKTQIKAANPHFREAIVRKTWYLAQQTTLMTNTLAN